MRVFSISRASKETANGSIMGAADLVALPFPSAKPLKMKN